MMSSGIQFPDPNQTVGSPASSPSVPGGKSAQAATGKEFKTILLESLEEVNRLQHEADQGVQRLLTGESDNVAEVIMAVNKAGIAFDLLMEIRNKLTEAYRDIQQMQV